MEKVLIALDYGPAAQKVAEAGFAMAMAMHAQVVLLHVISEPRYYMDAEYSPIMGFTGFTFTEPVEITSKESMKKIALLFLESIKKHLGGASIQTLVTEGDFAEMIVTTAINQHADTIVIGSHDRKWLEKITMGSVTHKVLDLTTVPLFIVPTKQQ